MAGGCTWSKRVAAHARTLRGIVRDTLKALEDAHDIVKFEPDVSEEAARAGEQCARGAALVLLGRSAAARAHVLHALLGRAVLPDLTRGARWLRFQYGSSPGVVLSLGAEFELVEELQASRGPWDVLPIEDILREGHLENDLDTMLEVKLNNCFLKDGLTILIPPDLDVDPGNVSLTEVKEKNADFFKKRKNILSKFNCVYLYAIDRIGRNIFSDVIFSDMTNSKSEEEFRASYNLYNRREDRSNGKDTSEQWNRRDGHFVFNSENCLDLYQMKDQDPSCQPFFLLLPDSESLPCGECGRKRKDNNNTTDDRSQPSPSGSHETQVAFMEELMEQWEVVTCPPEKHYLKSRWAIIDNFVPPPIDKSKREVDNKIIKTRPMFLNNIVKFAADSMHSYFLGHATRLSEMHVKLVQQLIFASFELARELQAVPKRIRYAAVREQELYETVSEKFKQGEKKAELVKLMQEVLDEMTVEVQNMDWSVDDLYRHQDTRYSMNSLSTRSQFSPETLSMQTRSVWLDSDFGNRSTDAASDASEFDFSEYELVHSATGCADHCSTMDSSEITIERSALSPDWSPDLSRLWSSGSCCSVHVSVKQATADVQHTVLSKLSSKISEKLIGFVDCLKDTYFGTLQRCVETLEQACPGSLRGRPASEAVRALRAAHERLSLPPAAHSLLAVLVHSLRRLFYRLRMTPDGSQPCCALSAPWRRAAAERTVRALSAGSLARAACLQILERVNTAHERYQVALAALQSAAENRLGHTAEVKMAIRSKYAPTFARLCLESTSMCDLLMYGMPELGAEIGRGQYGVVYACSSWAGYTRVAVKSVTPADERHANELAMEFYYTRSIPPHPRITPLLGSLCARERAGGGVLLVTSRAVRDLHAAVRAGLSLRARLRIALDIVEGIRYLHSLGLVHRDVKMKNVLLDSSDRAALCDLGFCASGALLSGSLVGTPVHMAPELCAGGYDQAVDVYAFGVLFWYICAGNIKLPAAYEVFRNKEQLWSKVKRGLRPERLPHFREDCWQLMQACWHPAPARRCLLGEVQERLLRVLEEVSQQEEPPIVNEGSSHESSDLDASLENSVADKSYSRY